MSQFKVFVLATGFDLPRWLAVAPDGDVFVADSGAGKVIVLRAIPRFDRGWIAGSLCRPIESPVRNRLSRRLCLRRQHKPSRALPL
jgi:hypothetical protein